jgi:uncharacterized protein (DUF427 family)
VSDFPVNIVELNHVEPVPRRVRATLGGETVLDTTNAKYVWEIAYFPQFYIPLEDVRKDLLESEDVTQHSPRGTVEIHSLKVGEIHKRHAAKVLRRSKIAGLDETVHIEWSAVDEWYEEDERVYVHPRNPYTRVDALRSTRDVRIELDGTLLARSSSPVMVFETGLPTRYYLNRTEVDFSRLVPSETVTECPYKGTTTGYWSAQVGGKTVEDVAWTYEFPTRQLLPISGLIAFYNEKVDITVDDRRLERPGSNTSH